MGGDLLQGTVELMVLKALSLEPMHGWGLGQRLDQMSGDVITLPHGSLYPALQRLEARGFIDAEWGTSDNNRKAKYYRLTPAGRKHLTRDRSRWELLVRAAGRVLGPAAE